MNLPDKVLRVWDGSGRTFVDGDGNLYRAAQFSEDALQQIEAAINGASYTLSLSLIGLPQMAGDEIWEYDETTPVSGAKFVIKIQEVDQFSQPLGAPEIVFTGMVDNMAVSDQAAESDEGDVTQSIVTIEVVNRFTLRTIANGSVLSDVDQRARAKQLNPSAPDDKFCARVPSLRDKTVRWPNW
ncbi:hypothetical protein KYK29_10450 [Shinella daejeonensis]|nr:hypothetical protein [Shinella daejeonensis]